MDRIEQVTYLAEKKEKINKKKKTCAIASNKLLWKFGNAADRALIRLPVTPLGIAFALYHVERFRV